MRSSHQPTACKSDAVAGETSCNCHVARCPPSPRPPVSVPVPVPVLVALRATAAVVLPRSTLHIVCLSTVLRAPSSTRLILVALAQHIPLSSPLFLSSPIATRIPPLISYHHPSSPPELRRRISTHRFSPSHLALSSLS